MVNYQNILDRLLHDISEKWAFVTLNAHLFVIKNNANCKQ